VLDGSRSETGAEHSWHVALCAVVLGPAFAPILLHSACDGATWRKRGQGRAKLDEFVAKITDLWPPLGPLTAALVEEAHRRGDLIDDRVA
jgi:hypothetical protein